MTASTKKKAPKRTGRPTAEESLQLDDTVRSVALDLFLDSGYQAVSMEAIAKASGITKRTLYARYKDKKALFADVLQWSRTQWAEFNFDIDPDPNLTLEEALVSVAESILERELNPKIVKLGRMAMDLNKHAPNLVSKNYNLSWSPRVQAITRVLERHQERNEIKMDDPEITADLLISLITGIPTRLASFGIFREPEYEQRRIREAVKIFLHGIAVPGD